MQDTSPSSVEYLLAGAVLVSRLGDIGSTWLATPTLRLEMNPLLRRWKWPFALSSLLLCLVPFWYAPAGMTIAVTSFLVTGRNLSTLWFVRNMGEDRVHALQLEAARRTSTGSLVALTWLAVLPLLLCSALMFMFSPGMDRDWGAWAAVGVAAYALAIGIHQSIYFARLVRESHRTLAT